MGRINRGWAGVAFLAVLGVGVAGFLATAQPPAPDMPGQPVLAAAEPPQVPFAPPAPVPPGVAAPLSGPMENGPPPVPVIPRIPSIPPAGPAAPSGPLPSIPVAPQKPAPASAPAEILEPVATVSRFDGQFLGVSDGDVIRYVRIGPGTAEVVCGPAGPAIPPADGVAPPHRYRSAVPAGTAVMRDKRVYVLAPRELVVLDDRGAIDWRFPLPGKPDDRDRFLGLIGFDAGKVLVASEFDSRNPTVPSTGRVFMFDAASGRLLDCTTFPGGFGGTAPTPDAEGKKLFAFRDQRIVCFDLNTGQLLWSEWPVNQPSASPLVVLGGGVLTTFGGNLRYWTEAHAPRWQIPGHAPESESVRAVAWDGFGYLGARMPGQVEGVWAVELNSGQVTWRRPLPAPLPVAPVATEASVYCVAGPTLYRLDRQTGAIGWKLTLPLEKAESVTGLSHEEGEVRVAGLGFVVRVRNRTEPAPQKAAAVVPVG